MNGMGNAAKAGNGKRRISIQVKMLGVVLLAVGLVGLGIMLTLMSRTSAIIKSENSALLEANAQSVVNEIEGWMKDTIGRLDTQRNVLETLGMTPDQELAYIQKSVDPTSSYPSGMYFGTIQKQMVHATFSDPSYDPTSRGWYQEGLNNAEFKFGSAYLDMDSGNIVVTASAVLKTPSGAVRGVCAGDVQLTQLANIVGNVKIKQTGGAYLVDAATGIILGASDSAVVGKTLSDQSKTSIYAPAIDWINGWVSGVQTAKANGENYYFHLELVPDTSWVAVCFVPEAEIMASVKSISSTLLWVAIASIIILSTLIFLLVKTIIIRPVRKLDAAAQSIADGDLNTRVDFHSNDEFGTLADNFGRTAERLHFYSDYINEIANVLNEIARGNLAFRLTLDYAGEFAKIKTALENISDSLNDTIAKIDHSSQQVSAGAGNLSNGSQSLSQGAAEQAAAVEELSATISELSEQVQKNANDAQKVSSEVSDTAVQVSQSNERMQDLIRSMTEISNSSMEIDKVIKIIEDIAFQTNILALNAAVEAARAGEAGKGFAVVADEVRNLATKSQEAAKSTSDLIKASVEAVKQGSGIADETAESLLAAADRIKAITGAVNGISEASEQQAVSIAQVSEGISQIAEVVQTNSATSEQTAASSEELSAQAALLSELVDKFQLKK